MRYITILVLILLFSCAEKPKNESKDFYEKIVDFVVKNSDDKLIELPNLYDSLVKNIAEDKNEKLILVEILKKQGFEIINSRRGNFPPLGARIISVTLKTDSCECVVNKMYYSTISDSLYEMRENIKCKKARR